MQSDKRIYTNVARDKIVEEGDPEAAFLVAGEGSEVPAEYAELYQEYAKPKGHQIEAVVAEPEAESEEKAVEKPAENKARVQAEKK